MTGKNIGKLAKIEAKYLMIKIHRGQTGMLPCAGRGPWLEAVSSFNTPHTAGELVPVAKLIALEIVC